MGIMLIKRDDASDSVLTVMIWAIFSLILVRIFLKLTGYPQIGQGIWHISHALFGGIIMTAGAMISLILYGNKIKKIGAGVFGFGLGWFIDEIGKYLTSDYNYFFQPAVLIIYIVFILLFFVYRFLEKSEEKSVEALYQSVVDQLSEVDEDSLPRSKKRAMIQKLRVVIGSGDQKYRYIATKLLPIIKRMKMRKDNQTRRAAVWTKSVFRVSYNKIFKRKLVVWGLWTYSIYFSIEKIWDLLMIGTSKEKMMMIQRFYEDYDFFGKSDIYMIVFKMIFDLLAAVLFLIGARYFWSKKRLRGIRFFKYGLYVSIFLVSIFRFYFEQFGGLYEVLVSIVLLGLLDHYQKEITTGIKRRNYSKTKRT